ncbi:hypothetical protein GPALN_006299 [Globodera pallida]|nr:hypothetical protein GPALN_006299 [Globodera pallida]
MNSKVGCSWRQLELRGQQNAAKSKQIFGALSPPHSFVVERENDGNSLLRFMKVVVPEYRELIPPPCLSTGFRLNQNRHNARIQGTAEPIGVTAPRQFRQNSETTMALNAFSDLEAIAEMGAGTDDAEAQMSESATRPSSKLTEHCSPTVVGNSFLSLPQQNAAAAAAPCDQRVRTEQHNATGGNLEPQHQLAQLSVEQQQQHRHRFGTSVVYRQQQPKLQQQQQPLVPMGGMNPTTGRMAMDTPPGLRHSASSDVFNFVPDHSPFDGAPNFATVSANPYQSPTGGITRRRGRGRRAGNVGDRQPSTSSSVEHEGTPESPSEFGTLRKHRGSGTPGQRRARKPRKPMNIGGFDPQEGIALSRSPYHSAESHSINMGQLPPLAATSSNYISPQIEEDIRSKMMTDYEMHFCESSSDDEMDPPPPPKNLVMPPKSSNVDCEQKVPPSSELDSAASGCAVGAERPSVDGNEDGGGERKCVPPSAKCSIPSGHSNGEQQPTDVGKALLLQEIKHVSTAPSSVSSSPSLSQLGEQSDHRTSMATVVKSEMDTAGFKRAENAKLGDIFDNEVGTTSIKIVMFLSIWQINVCQR